MTTFPTDIAPFVRVQKRACGTSWYAFLHKVAHVAFAEGTTEREATANLAAFFANNEPVIRRVMRTLGLLPALTK